MAFRDKLEKVRQHLASSQAVFVMAALGLISGVIAASVILAFRVTIDAIQASFMPFGDVGRFETLSTTMRVGLPICGAIVIGLVFQYVSSTTRRVGVSHVLERLQYHEGHLPYKNLFMQFFGGVVALSSGQSVGREAPSIHLGAAVSSLFGQHLQLPNITIRLLVACGAAAAIAASFNTPLAGVIFAMEVILMEYTVASFTPVIIASVAATVITRAAYGDNAVFFLPQLALSSMWELSYILLMGVCLGALSAFFIAMIRYIARQVKPLPVFVSVSLCGLLVAIIAIEIPEVLGMGYDTINAAVLGDLALATLGLVLLAKLVASAACIAVGIPGGLIGPTLVIGAMVGGLFAYGANYIPGFTSGYGLYVMLGMGAMMSATLHAPLAALVTLSELTANPHLILPAMLAIVSANITARELFAQESVFTMLMRDAGLDYRNDPLSQSLRHVAVAAVMNRSFVELDETVALSEIPVVLADTPQWIVIRKSDGRRTLLPATDLARAAELPHDGDETIELMSIPGQRTELAAVHLQATMHEARDTMDRTGTAALYVRRPIAPLTDRTYGVIVRSDIESSYALRRYR